ncbi:uncharacterized protein PITG_23341 [Phytophthora infestans T30-4]|uniref:Uncharacterized protein n=1 Tax=Phytophthora infestans (strain T30-4) TaxID=403677 RepID=D0NUZ7_PHYIT|nr:uncharacterized protein PITG_23341 [Phytophthora infestans T30-4]EEY66469.1 conserved hypothetical protein [Phytophthora infestans T30-4]|eukprot:XP_002896988.1 conserved hypothetical protein [Phytophthora infestans T30-4]
MQCPETESNTTAPAPAVAVPVPPPAPPVLVNAGEHGPHRATKQPADTRAHTNTATADLTSIAQPTAPRVALPSATVSQQEGSPASDEADEGSEDEQESDEEADDSDDEDWSDDNEDEEEDEEASTGESGVSDAAEEEEDISINLIEVSLQQTVAGLIQADKCDRRCLQGKAQELEWLVCSISQMTRSEKLTSLYTMLGVLMQTDTVERHRGDGKREKCHYYLPLVGRVCRPMFAECLGVTPLTIQRYKKRVREGNIAAKAHGNTLNKHASVIDLVWLVKWFKEFSAEVGVVVPVRVRLQKTANGTVKKYYSSEMYTLLPPTFTWDAIYDEMHTYVEEIRIRVREPAKSTMRQLLTLHCPNIRIRSWPERVKMRWEETGID